MLQLYVQSAEAQNSRKWAEKFDLIIENTNPIPYDRANRLPLYLWPTLEPGDLSEKDAELLVKELNTRGIALFGSWNKNDPEASLSRALKVAKVQKKLGLQVNINAISQLYSFYNGDSTTAHVDEQGVLFFDDSFLQKKNMGCPFAIDFRKTEIKQDLEYFLNSYEEHGLEVDFIFADWEVDGPMELNGTFENSRKCIRCRRHLGENIEFMDYQRIMRQMRSYLQFYAFSQPVLSRFPKALVGNYAVYLHNGYRYWYDYFDVHQPMHPAISDQMAEYRVWSHDFPTTGFTMAMPVAYTWARIYNWYNFEPTDYRWFYNMLLVASNAGKSTPQNIPIITWVHWNTIHYPNDPEPEIVQFSQQSYQELLWHILLRGTDTFAMWCMEQEYSEEVRLIQEVYAEAQQYGDFLDYGLPITFDLPKEPGTVISGLLYQDRVLVRRTDFGQNRQPVTILAGTSTVTIPYKVGNQIIAVNE